MSDTEQSWRELEAAIEAFRRVAKKAVDVAAAPRSTRAEFDEARIQATFALASIGAQLKRVLLAAADGEGPSSRGEGPPPKPWKSG